MAPAVETLVAMTDAFEGIDRLAEGAPKTDGAPNFRRVSLHLRYAASMMFIMEEDQRKLAIPCLLSI